MAHYFIANYEKHFVAIASPKCASTAVRRWFLQTAGVNPATLRAIERYLVVARRVPKLAGYEPSSSSAIRCAGSSAFTGNGSYATPPIGAFWTTDASSRCRGLPFGL